MMINPAFGRERRKYYRISDEVLLHFEVVNETRDESAEGVPLELSTGDLLAEIDRELNQTINLVWGTHPEIGRALGLLNRKISVLGALAGEFDDGGPASYNRARVSLSGSGIAFETAQALVAGTQLQLRIGLLPSETNLRLSGMVVVDAEPVEDMAGRYWVRVSFDENPDIQEELIRHVVQRQGALLAER